MTAKQLARDVYCDMTEKDNYAHSGAILFFSLPEAWQNAIRFCSSDEFRELAYECPITLVPSNPDELPWANMDDFAIPRVA